MAFPRRHSSSEPRVLFLLKPPCTLFLLKPPCTADTRLSRVRRCLLMDSATQAPHAAPSSSPPPILKAAAGVQEPVLGGEAHVDVGVVRICAETSLLKCSRAPRRPPRRPGGAIWLSPGRFWKAFLGCGRISRTFNEEGTWGRGLDSGPPRSPDCSPALPLRPLE